MSSMTDSSSVYQRVVRITHIYLGPAADRFIDRQVQSHLHKEPEKLSAADLALLTDWIRVAVSLLTDDEEIIEEYINQLQLLIDKPTKAQKGSHRHA